MTEKTDKEAERVLAALRVHLREEPPGAELDDISARVMKTLRTRKAKARLTVEDARPVWLAASLAAACAACCCFLLSQQLVSFLDLGMSIMIEEGSVPGML